MKSYFINRLLYLLPVMLGVSFLTFALMHSVSGDAVDALYEHSGGVSEQVKIEKRIELGLDKPFIVQYVTWLQKISKGDWGTSYISDEKVSVLMQSKLPATAALAGVAIALTLIYSIPMGFFAALYRNTYLDYAIRALSFIGNAAPGFFSSLVLIYVFSLKLHWLPVLGHANGYKGLILPALTLSLSMSAKYIRQTRAIVLEELGKPYVAGARSRGIREEVILSRSVLKSTGLGLLTLIGLSIGSLLGGTAIIESIFMWDGIGKLAIDAILMRDYPVIEAYVTWMAIIYVSINLLTDILYHLADPRIRKTMEP